MKAVTILKRCRSAEADKRRIRQRIQQRREAMVCVTPRLDAAGGGRGASDGDKMTAYVSAIDDLEQALYQREQERMAEVAAACALLDMLPAAESAVLHKYYVLGAKLPGIAQELSYTEGYVRNLKCDGERLLEALPEQRVLTVLPHWYTHERALI